MRKSSNPMAMSAEKRSPSASPNWFAIILAIVLAVAVSDCGIWLVFPMSIVTVIVSPNALPIANMYDEKIPEPATGKTTSLITSARVAPRLYALSFISFGTILMNSALSDAAYGTIIMASTNDAVSMPEPCGDMSSAIMSGRSV